MIQIGVQKFDVGWPGDQLYEILPVELLYAPWAARKLRDMNSL